MKNPTVCALLIREILVMHWRRVVGKEWGCDQEIRVDPASCSFQSLIQRITTERQRPRLFLVLLSLSLSVIYFLTAAGGGVWGHCFRGSFIQKMRERPSGQLFH